MNTDRIEKKILLRATLERVWRAISDSTEFGSWFGMKFDGPFRPGAKMSVTIVGTTVDPEVAKQQAQHAGVAFEITIDKIEPERLFSFRWHPHAVEPGADYAAEPTTLVAFSLEQVADGVMLTVSESGFDQIPIDRRAKAFTANEGGWSIVVKLIEGYLGHAPKLESHAGAD
jgi:uncharacterized protein YndB with AHSA1/START domain